MKRYSNFVNEFKRRRVRPCPEENAKSVAETKI